MLLGQFGVTTGRPHLEGRLYVPRLNIQGDVSFLVDTGADSSMLMPADSIRLGIPFDRLTGDSECGGIGGVVHSFVERALLIFTEANIAAYVYELQLDILPSNPEMMDCPSLLGRDVLDNWRIIYDPTKSNLKVHVHRASMVIDLKKLP